MTFADDLKAALGEKIPAAQLHYLDGWRGAWYRDSWAGGVPVALVLHHTAGAATGSQDADHPGNAHGANDGQIDYVNRHPSYAMPASAFTLDRDGCLYVNAALPCYHAGAGSFAHTLWADLGVPNDRANDYCLGVECVDKGSGTTFTKAMKTTLARLAQACAIACDWPDTSTLRLPRHRDWAPDRKVDIKYANDTVQGWIADYGSPLLWDGHVPDPEGVYNAMNIVGLANPASYRLACRLADLGHFDGTPIDGAQAYPARAVTNWQKAAGWLPVILGGYSPAAHDGIFR
jgi:hypothetical protein